MKQIIVILCLLIQASLMSQITSHWSFDNNSRFVWVGNFEPSEGDFTLSKWINPHPDNHGDQILMAKRSAWKEGSLRWQVVIGQYKWSFARDLTSTPGKVIRDGQICILSLDAGSKTGVIGHIVE